MNVTVTVSDASTVLTIMSVEYRASAFPVLAAGLASNESKYY
jgi:hypothetical protein